MAFFRPTNLMINGVMTITAAGTSQDEFDILEDKLVQQILLRSPHQLLIPIRDIVDIERHFLILFLQLQHKR